jgi:endoglucanase
VDNDNSHEDEGKGRYLYPPSTAATLNLAATAAQCARIWREIDPQFGESCLAASETAWDAARANPGIYAGNTPGTGGGNYDDRTVADEFFWAAAELFITTGKDEYQSALLESGLFGEVDSFDWGDTASLGAISLLLTENGLPKDRIAVLEEEVIAFADEMIGVQNQDGYSVLIDGKYPWG